MKKNLRNRYLSKPRYDRYLIASAYNDDRARLLYNAGIALSEAFHPLISQFEVVLRNAIDSVLAKHFNDNSWVINEKAGFMNDRSLEKSNFYLRKCVETVENKLRKTKTPVTSGKVISDQTFGFWIAFFEPANYRLMNGRPIQIFKHKPAFENRASIYAKLEMIRDFRNRVNHCEPICFNDNRIG